MKALMYSACLAMGLGLSGCGSTGHLTSHTSGPQGNFASFQGSTIDGKRFNLNESLGRDVVLVSFWATYCEPCKAEMTVLQRLHEQYAQEGLRIVSVSIDGPDSAGDVAPYIRRQGYTFEVLIDEDGAIAQRHNPTMAAPYTLIVDRSGSIVKRMAGFQPSEAPELERELVHLLKAEP